MYAPKTKINCRFNGSFRFFPSSLEFRYVGGETRIISINPTIKISQLLSKLSEFCPNNSSLSLKYHLPLCEDAPLISLKTDDDVQYMMEEFHQLGAMGRNIQLRLFVSNVNQDSTSVETNSSFPGGKQKPAVPTRKIKLFCRFNGAFRYFPCSKEFRYAGGEARIISIDPTVKFSELFSKLSELCSNNTTSVSLKYHLPLFEDAPLISLKTDDDVRYMIEELLQLEAEGKNVRLHLFVSEAKPCSSPCRPQFGKSSGKLGVSARDRTYKN